MAPFSQVLRTGNQQQHTAAERSPFMADLLTGRLSLAGFARFSGQLYFVYEVLGAAGGRMPPSSTVHGVAIALMGVGAAAIAAAGEGVPPLASAGRCSCWRCCTPSAIILSSIAFMASPSACSTSSAAGSSMRCAGWPRLGCVGPAAAILLRG